MSGILSVVGTPIGNLDDLSPRAARTLATADVVACEDTRVARTLLRRATQVAGARTHARLVACHARNEQARIPELVAAIASGSRVALTTDAGMPAISDPGFRLIAACIDAGHRIEVIPGPSAVPAALVLSGFPTARFVFEGFLPRTAGARARHLQQLATERRTLVFFEAPHRIVATLDAMATAFGPRRAALARELTKVYEEVLRAPLPELAERMRANQPRGELTLVVEGAPEAQQSADFDPAAEVAAMVGSGVAKKDAIAAVARARGVPKRIVYQAVVDAPPS